MFSGVKKTHAVKLISSWNFIWMFPQGFQRRSVEKEKIAQSRRAEKCSRKDSICGYRKLADSDRMDKSKCQHKRNQY